MTDSSAHEPPLPGGFERLQELVAAWALPTEHARRERRATASMSELQNFHEIVGPVILDIARHLDAFAIAPSLPSPELRLLQLAQMYMEVAWAVEVLGGPEEPDQVPRERWKITPLKRQIFTAATDSPSPLPRSL
jgi:hypothetical protein